MATDKETHGALLKKAIAVAGIDRLIVADAAGVKTRTVTNWTRGATMPSDREKVALRKLLGPYDTAGDQVEQAIRQSELSEWRQDTVVGFYKRNLAEQREGQAG